MTDLTTDLSSLRISGNTAPHRTRSRALVLGAIVALFGAGIFWSIFGVRRSSAALKAAATPPRSATVADSSVLTASGYIVARRKAVVSSKIQGRLAELAVDEGSRVAKGEVIARLDSADYRAQVAVARAQWERSEADLVEQQRQLRLTENLARGGVVSRDQWDAAVSRVQLAEASRAQAKAALELSEANFQNTVIRAPFDGVVLRKMAEVGESVAPIPPGVNLSTSSGAIVALADPGTLEVEADVSESNLARLQPGQPANVIVDAFPDRTFPGTLRQIVPTADRTKATVTVKVSIRDDDETLKPEMSAKVTFLAPPR